jgi:iron complex transport system ATP-binding protein
MSALEAQGVCVAVGKQPLLDGVSLRVEPGEWLTMIGPNGAGKTTFVHAVAGLRRFDAGHIALSGRPLSSLRDRQRAALVAFVPQTPVVPEGMTVFDYVLLGRVSHRPLLRAETPEDLRVVREAVDRLELGSFCDRAIQTLSGGERQRAVIARALVQEAPLLVLDEPTTGLDLRHQLEVLEALAQLRRERGIAVLATLHDLTLAGRFADRLCLLDAGRLVRCGPPGEVLTAEVLRAHYGVDVTVLDVDGTPVVVPGAQH